MFIPLPNGAIFREPCPPEEPAPGDRRPKVYFESAETGRIKVGMTTRAPRARMSGVQVRILAPYRCRGEWFEAEARAVVVALLPGRRPTHPYDEVTLVRARMRKRRAARWR